MISIFKSFLKTILRYKSLGINFVIFMIVVTTFLEVFSVLAASVLVNLLMSQNPDSFESSHWLEQAYLDNFGYQMALMLPLIALITAPVSKIYLFKKLFAYAMRIEAMLQNDVLLMFLKRNYLNQKTENKAVLFKDILNETAYYVHSGLLPFIMLIYGLFSTLFLVLALSFYEFRLMVVLFLCVFTVFAFTSVFLAKKISLAGANREKYTEQKFSLLDFLLNNISQVSITKNKSNILNSFKTAAFETGTALANSLSYSQLPRLMMETVVYVITAVLLLLITAGIIESFSMSLIPVYLVGFMKLIPALNLVYQNSTTIRFVKPSVDKVSILLSTISHDKEENSKYSIDYFSKIGNGVIELDKVSFGYSNKDILYKDLDLVIENNDWIFIQGQSGSGKSTFVEIVLGLIPPVSGKVSWVKTLKTSEIQYLSQGSNYKTGNLQEYSELFGEKNDYISDDFGNLLNMLKLNIKQLDNYSTWCDLELATLSGGELQRIQLFLALLQNPKILILDEATNAIDSKLEMKILTDLRMSKKFITLHISHGNMVPGIYSKILNFNANGSMKITEIK